MSYQRSCAGFQARCGPWNRIRFEQIAVCFEPEALRHHGVGMQRQT
jgi:hypothetical protein